MARTFTSKSSGEATESNRVFRFVLSISLNKGKFGPVELAIDLGWEAFVGDDEDAPPGDASGAAVLDYIARTLSEMYDGDLTIWAEDWALLQPAVHSVTVSEVEKEAPK